MVQVRLFADDDESGSVFYIKQNRFRCVHAILDGSPGFWFPRIHALIMRRMPYMTIRSNESITSSYGQRLRTCCSGIGNTNVVCGGETNLGGVKAVENAFADANRVCQSYKNSLESLAANIEVIGGSLAEVDNSLL